MSNWEVEYDKEQEAEMEKYKQEVMDDFVQQNGGYFEPVGKAFIDFLLLRMFYEGLPSKEPKIDR